MFDLLCELYACGGMVCGPNGRTLGRLSVEGFNPSLGKWEILAKMHNNHSGTVPVALGEYMYVCGGLYIQDSSSKEEVSKLRAAWSATTCRRRCGYAMSTAYSRSITTNVHPW